MSTSTCPSTQTKAGIDSAAQDVFASEGSQVNARSEPVGTVGDAEQEEQARLMATLGIRHEGR